MPGFNLFGTLRDFFTDKLPNTFRRIGSRVGEGLQSAGNAIGGFKNTLGSAYGKLKGIPFLGDIISKSPVGALAEKGLDVLGSGGNLLSELGKGNVGGALAEGANIASQAGGFGKLLGESEPLNARQQTLVDRFRGRIKPA